MSLSSGTRLGPYEIVAPLGAGGMGEVYRARDSRLDRPVAVKVLPDARANEPELLARFDREARAIAALRHPHICTVHDVGFEHGSHFIVMELVDGQTLADLIQRGPVPRDQAIAIALQLCDALAAAHAQGIIHRDLKPGNVVIERSASGHEMSAKLLDFGLARWGGGPPTSDIATRATADTLSSQGEVLGTYRYMAPEQLRGERVDQRADIWAMGCLLYEMLTGHDVRARQAITPRRLERIVARCLSEDQDARYADALSLASDLRAVMHPTPTKRIAGAAGLVLLALVAGLSLLPRWTAPAPTNEETLRAPLSMVIADFENRTGDQVFDGALEHAIAIGLETASFVSVIPRQEALASAAVVGGRLDVATARLVAQRDGVGAVVAGVVSTTANGYIVTAHVLDPVPGTPIVSARQSAATKNEVLGAMAAIAQELRRGLGDHELSSATEFAHETFTTTSLDAAREYALGQEASASGREEQAVEHYRAAIRHDPMFGRAYAGLGASSQRLGRVGEATELLARAMSLRDRMTERERLRTEGLHALFTQDEVRGAEIFERLAAKYPADHVAVNNLAVAQFRLLRFQDSLTTGLRVVTLRPRGRYVANLALYAMYAGDLTTASEQAQEALKLSAQSTLAFLPIAVSRVFHEQWESARDAYAQMAKTGARGAALSVVGLADLASMQGRNDEAMRIAAAGLAKEARENVSMSAALRLMRAELALQSNDRVAGRNEARAVLANADAPATVFRAAEILVLTGDSASAVQHVDKLPAQSSASAKWYRRILRARIGEASRDFAALDELEAALSSDPPMWIAHYAAGVMQLARGRTKEALDHLNWCLDHGAAGSAAFLDDVPTLRYLPQARYWRAHALESVSVSAARTDYQELLRVRRGEADDHLAQEARKRLEQLGREDK